MQRGPPRRGPLVPKPSPPPLTEEEKNVKRGQYFPELWTLYTTLWPPSKTAETNSDLFEQQRKVYLDWVLKDLDILLGFSPIKDYYFPYFKNNFPPDLNRLKHAVMVDLAPHLDHVDQEGMFRDKFLTSQHTLVQQQILQWIQLYGEVVSKTQDMTNFKETLESSKELILNIPKQELPEDLDIGAAKDHIWFNYPEVWKTTFNGTEVPDAVVHPTHSFQTVGSPDPLQMIRFFKTFQVRPNQRFISLTGISMFSKQEFKELFNSFYSLYVAEYAKPFNVSFSQKAIELYGTKSEYLFNSMEHLLSPEMKKILFPKGMEKGWWAFLMSINVHIIHFILFDHNPLYTMNRIVTPINPKLIQFPTEEAYIVDQFKKLPVEIQLAFDVQNPVPGYGRELDNPWPMDLELGIRFASFFLYWDKSSATYRYPSFFNMKDTFHFVKRFTDGSMDQYGSSGFRSFLSQNKIQSHQGEEIAGYAILYMNHLRWKVKVYLEKTGIGEDSLASTFEGRDKIPQDKMIKIKLKELEKQLGSFSISPNLKEQLDLLKKNWQVTGEWKPFSWLTGQKEFDTHVNNQKLTKQEQQYVDFIEMYPLQRIKDPGMIGFFKEKLHPEDFQQLKDFQWKTYLVWVFHNIQSIEKNDPDYVGPGEKMMYEGKPVTLLGHAVVNSCFDVGILEHDENKRPWWFYQPVSWGFTVLGDFFFGGAFWSWIGNVAHKLFRAVIDTLKKIYEKVILPLWDQYKEYILLGGVVVVSVLLGTAVLEDVIVDKIRGK
jgi:hypothetical protein